MNKLHWKIRLVYTINMALDPLKYKGLFREILNESYGMHVDFQTIEYGLKHLKKGDPLSYEDLELIECERYWPFKKYWMWPSRDQIQDKLILTKGKFQDLDCSEDHEEREKDLICCLLGIFKNLSLVSIVLRFVWPEFYAIYSRPNLWVLRIARRSTDYEEYMNYIRVMNILKRTFKLERTADVDMVVWAIAKLEKKGYSTEILNVLADQLYEDLSPKEIVMALSDNPLKIAWIYFMKGDYKTSGYWAAQAFEIFLQDEYRRKIGIYKREDPKVSELKDMINQLCGLPEYKNKRKALNNLRLLRNKAIHPGEQFDEFDAYTFLNGIEALKKEKL